MLPLALLILTRIMTSIPFLKGRAIDSMPKGKTQEDNTFGHHLEGSFVDLVEGV
jgi:hypothetical protein